MDARTTTILSGFILLVVFALAGWHSKKKRDRRERGHLGQGDGHDNR